MITQHEAMTMILKRNKCTAATATDTATANGATIIITDNTDNKNYCCYYLRL
jgi:hypothetical protein